MVPGLAVSTSLGPVEHHERVLARLLAAAEAVEAGSVAPSHLVSESHAAHKSLDGAHADWQRLCWEMFLPDEAVGSQAAQRRAVVSAAAPYVAQIRARLD